MSVKSADRGLKLFELFASKQEPLSVSQIATSMDIPQSSASMLVQSMVDLGYLERNVEDRTYYPTFRIALLGTWIRRRHKRTGRLPRFVAELAKETGETVVLATKNGISAQYVMVQLGPDPLRLHVESGVKRPLVCCAPGWALLSFLPDREINKIIRKTRAETDNDYWRQTAEQAAGQIKLAQKNGWVMSDGQTTPGASSVAILLPAAAARIPVAISVGGPSERIHSNKDHILECLREVSSRVNNIDSEL